MGISILGDIHLSPGWGPKQPALALRPALLWAGGWMKDSRGPFQPVHCCVAVRADRQAWLVGSKAGLHPMGMKHLHTLWRRGRDSEAGSTSPATPSASKPEGAAETPKAQPDLWPLGPWCWFGVSSLPLSVGCRTWCLLDMVVLCSAWALPRSTVAFQI